MVIKGKKLINLIKNISNCPLENIGFSEVDVRLDSHFWIEKNENYPIRTDAPDDSIFDKLNVDCYKLKPNEFVKAQIMEIFEMPDNVMGIFTLRSRNAQQGLDQSTSFLLKPNWNGKLILELKNQLQHHPIKLIYGSKIGQIAFFEH